MDDSEGALDLRWQLEPDPLDWGPKRHTKPWTYFGNDDVARDLRELNATGLEVTPDVAQRLKPVGQLSEALKAVPRTDPKGIVMAAVRAIEHCNTWTTTQGRKQRTEFIASYLLDEFTRASFLKRALEHTGQAMQVGGIKRGTRTAPGDVGEGASGARKSGASYD